MSEIPKTEKELSQEFWRKIAERKWTRGQSYKLRQGVHAAIAEAEWRRTAALNYAQHMSELMTNIAP